jgi:nitrogen fixation protein FixH
MVTVVALAPVACGRDAGAPEGANPGQPTVATGQRVTVEFRSEPDPPQTGENAYQVTVRQPDGTPVTDAAVTAVFSMPPMPSMNMPAMRSDASLTHAGNGTYRGSGQLSMGGTWNVEVSVARGAEPPDTVRFSIVAQ